MRAILLLLLMASTLAGCSDGGEAPTMVHDGHPAATAPPMTLTNLTADGSAPFLVGGALGPGALLYPLGARPDNATRLVIDVTWECASCVAGQELTVGIQDGSSAPGEFVTSVSGTGALHLEIAADQWPAGGAEVYAIPTTDATAASPMLLFTYSLTGYVESVGEVELEDIDEHDHGNHTASR